MGLTSFIKKFQDKKKAKRLKRSEDRIVNNLILFTQDRINLAECINTLAYFTEERIQIITKFDSYSEKTAKDLVLFYIKYFQLLLKGDPNYKYVEDLRSITLWVLAYLYKQNQSIDKESLGGLEYESISSLDDLNKYDKAKEKYQNQFIYDYKKITHLDTNEPDKLVDHISNKIFNKYDQIYDFDVTERKAQIQDIIKVESKRFRTALEEWNTDNLKSISKESDFPDNITINRYRVNWKRHNLEQ